MRRGERRAREGGGAGCRGGEGGIEMGGGEREGRQVKKEKSSVCVFCACGCVSAHAGLGLGYFPTMCCSRTAALLRLWNRTDWFTVRAPIKTQLGTDPLHPSPVTTPKRLSVGEGRRVLGEGCRGGQQCDRGRGNHLQRTNLTLTGRCALP